jgi:hypothetical protein
MKFMRRPPSLSMRLWPESGAVCLARSQPLKFYGERVSLWVVGSLVDFHAQRVSLIEDPCAVFLPRTFLLP